MSPLCFHGYSLSQNASWHLECMLKRPLELHTCSIHIQSCISATDYSFFLKKTLIFCYIYSSDTKRILICSKKIHGLVRVLSKFLQCSFGFPEYRSYAQIQNSVYIGFFLHYMLYCLQRCFSMYFSLLVYEFHLNSAYIFVVC